MDDLATPNAKKRTFSESFGDTTNSQYSPPSKKHKTETPSEKIELDLAEFKPKSQEANDIIQLMNLCASVNDIKREIKKKTKSINQEIEMFRSLSICETEIQPRYDAKSELYIIEYRLNSSLEDTHSNGSNHHSTPQHTADLMEIDSSSNEEKSDDTAELHNDHMLSQLISMGFDHSTAHQATHKFTTINNECIEFLLDHQDPEHLEHLDHVQPMVDDTEQKSIYDDTNTNSNSNSNSTAPICDNKDETASVKPTETHPNHKYSRLKRMLFCYVCGVKWRLKNVEFYRKYTICEQCPDNIPVLYDDNFFCPTCLHQAHLHLQPAQPSKCKYQCGQTINPQPTTHGTPYSTCCKECGSNAGFIELSEHSDACKQRNTIQSNPGTIDLSVIDKLDATQHLYVQIRRNENEFDIYRVSGVENESIVATKCDPSGHKPKKKQTSEPLDLSDIASDRIIWSYCPKRGYGALCTSQVTKIVAVHDDKSITIKTKQNPQGTKVQLEQIIHTAKWLVHQERKTRKALKQDGITLDLNSVYVHSNALKKSRAERPRIKSKSHRVRRPPKRTHQVEVVETAPLNERHFNNNRNSTTHHNQSNNNNNPIAATSEKKIRWRCDICTFDNTSVAQTPLRCEMCETEREPSMDIDAPDADVEEKTGHILCALRNKLNTNQNTNNSRNADVAPKGTFAGDMDLIYEAIQNPIVAVVGPSGSGKSTLLRSMCAHFEAISNDPDLEWDDGLGIISQFGDEQDTDAVISLMSSIGLNSVPSWLKPFHILSNGEQYRASFARLLHIGLKNKNQWLMKDEFTSCLDRANARCIAAAISKFIRQKQNEDHDMARFIVATSKVDIIGYLQPNRVISLAGNDRYKILKNPNDLSDTASYAPDVKVIVDLPKFAEVRKSIKSLYEDGANASGAQQMKVIRTISIQNKVSRLQSQIAMDDHTHTVGSVFDIAFEGKITTDIPYLEREHIDIHGTEFEIGCIYGPSGSGKTTTGERLFGRIVNRVWDANKTVCEHFVSLDDMEEKFEAVSLALELGVSKYEHLSQGEQDRVNIAIRLGENNVLIDEFTSNLDRPTAKRLAVGVREYICRNKNKGIVILTCHADYIDELKPNWLFDIENKKVYHYEVPQSDDAMESDQVLNHTDYYETQHEYIDNEDMWRKAVVRLSLRPTKYTDFDPKFSKYHYMTQHIACSALCFTAWATFGKEEEDEKDTQSEIVGFISVMQNPFVNNMDGDHKFHYREHRTVILPAYQGLGFGSRICDAVAYWLSLNDKRMQSKTAHPRYGRYRDHSPLWMPLSTNHNKQKRIVWQNKADRDAGIKKGESSEKDKIFYSHVFKLKYQRTESDERYLNQRVIVKNMHRYEEE